MASVESQPIDRSLMQRVVAVINSKGGVGKTTLTANIGGLLAASGWKVLLVDLDYQGNLGLDLGYGKTDRDDNGLELAKAILFDTEPAKPIKDVRPNLDVLAGGMQLEAATASLVAKSTRGDVTDARLAVARVLERIAGEYDIVLMDCPPMNETMQSAAMAAAKYLLIPMKTDKGSLDGLELTSERLERVEALNPDLDLLGIVVFDSGTSERAVRERYINKIVEQLGGEEARPYVFKSFHRHAMATGSAARDQGLLVHELESEVKKGPKWYEALKPGSTVAPAGPASSSSVADDIQAITQELIARLTAFEEKAEQEASNV